MVGRRTVEKDNPLLTARPPGARTATRIVLDSRASLSPESRLVHTAGEVPVLLAVGPDAEVEQQDRLRRAGCEVFVCPGQTPAERLDALLAELGRRRMTNLLVEGGAKLLGGLLDARAIDEVHVFVAPKLVGGAEAIGPVGGRGVAELSDALQLHPPRVEQIGPDVYITGRVLRAPVEQPSRDAD